MVQSKIILAIRIAIVVQRWTEVSQMLSEIIYLLREILKVLKAILKQMEEGADDADRKHHDHHRW